MTHVHRYRPGRPHRYRAAVPRTLEAPPVPDVTLLDRDGTAYELTTLVKGHCERVTVRELGKPLVVARLRYDWHQDMVVSVWTQRQFRRRGIATALVTRTLNFHPEAEGRYPEVTMSPAMHEFLTAFLRRRGQPQRAPGAQLRRAT